LHGDFPSSRKPPLLKVNKLDLLILYRIFAMWVSSTFCTVEKPNLTKI